MNTSEKCNYLRNLLEEYSLDKFFIENFLDFTHLYFSQIEEVPVSNKIDSIYFKMDLETYLNHVNLDSLKDLYLLSKDKYQDLNNKYLFLNEDYFNRLTSYPIFLLKNK